MHRVNIHFHGNCLDGAVSAAIFTLFYQEKLVPDAEFHYHPMAHTPGFTWDGVEFDGDDNVILDFRYAPSDRVKWFFDHHATTFAEPAHRKHFERRHELPPHCFWNPSAPSNAGFLAAMLRKHYGYHLPTIGERLLVWTDMIDAANFPSPEIPVELVELAPAFASLLEGSTDPQDTPKFIADLVAGFSFDDMSRAPYWSNRLNRVRQANWDAVEDVKRVQKVHDGVSFVDLSSAERDSFNKFIPYYLAPTTLYSVGLLLYRGRVKLSVGTNPWHDLRHADPVLDIGALCERHGGGGHTGVGAVSFRLDEAERARTLAHEFVEHLQKHHAQLKIEEAKRRL